MKICTITCHDVYNYGASLQAYALQTFLLKNGFDNEIIDYLPEYKYDRLNFFEYNRKRGRIYSIVKVCPFLKQIVGLYDHLSTKEKRSFLRFVGKKRKFKDFKFSFLKCTPDSYRNEEQLEMNAPQADVYITGSDQVWNSLAYNGRDPAFFCAFAPKGSKLISYAASFGTPYIMEGYESFTKEMLKRFNSISVRESSGVKLVERLGFSATEVLDPVFLLDSDEWEKFGFTTCSDNYIVVYDLCMNHQGVEDFVVSLAKKNNWRIYSINDFKVCPYADVNINNAGPLEFIDLIKNAQFVVCTSFHGTAFSVIFRKQFYTFPLYGQKNSSRMKDFLNSIGIGSHYVENNISIDEISYIEYDLLYPKLQEKVRFSRSWLLGALS